MGREVALLSSPLSPTLQRIQLYIVTLGVLAPYRRRGIASALLTAVLRHVTAELPEVARAILHVHTVNDEALAFYARHGFHRGEVLTGYYKRLRPPDALVLTRQLHVVPAAPGEVALEG